MYRCRALLQLQSKLALAMTVPRASGTAAGRLSQISHHLAGNTYSDSSYIEPTSSIHTNSPFTVQQRRLSTESNKSVNMSSQPDHPTLLIPGPIEFDDAVLQSMSHYR